MLLEHEINDNSSHNFYHGTRALLSWHVQNFDLIESSGSCLFMLLPGGYSLCDGWYICAAVLTPFFHFGRIEHDLFGVFFSSTNSKAIFWGTKTTNFYKNRSFWPQIQFFPRSFWVQFSAASGTPPSVFRPSTPPPPPPPPGCYCQPSNLNHTFIGNKSNIFIITLTSGFKGLGKDNSKTRLETF